MESKEQATGELFGNLFAAYDKDAFQFSLDLFSKRFRENEFPVDWFLRKKCLDVGCGGGRYSMALAKLGAEYAVGIDISEEAIQDAGRRAADLEIDNVDFRVLSASKLPFGDNSFDFIMFSGVLMHLANPVTVLNELTRVLRSKGILYLLVYATEGVRWPLIQMLRPIAQTIGFEIMDQAVSSAVLPVNKRRTYLDDLFVPYIDFYSWQCLKDLLQDKGFTNVERWEKGRLDHEEDFESYINDLYGLYELFRAAAGVSVHSLIPHMELIQKGKQLCGSVLDYVRSTVSLFQEGKLSEAQARMIIIGQGHHRIIAKKD